MIDALTVAPSQARPDTFDQDADLWCSQQLTFQSQINRELGTLNPLFAGGAYSFLYAFSSSIAAANPGAGKCAFNNASLASATALRINPATVAGANIDSLFASLLSGNSVIKGAIRLVKASDPTAWALFDISGSSAATDYRNLIVAYRGGSSATPFSNGDNVMVFFDRGGEAAVPFQTQIFSVSFQVAAGSGGTGGGAGAAATWNIRSLNTVEVNEIPGASLSGSIISLPVGNYEIFARAQAYQVNGHQIRLLNTQGGVVYAAGTNAFCSTTAGVSSESFIEARRNVSGGSVSLRLEHYTQQASGTSGDLGYGLGTDGATVKTFARVYIRKVG